MVIGQGFHGCDVGGSGGLRAKSFAGRGEWFAHGRQGATDQITLNGAAPDAAWVAVVGPLFLRLDGGNPVGSLLVRSGFGKWDTLGAVSSLQFLDVQLLSSQR